MTCKSKGGCIMRWKLTRWLHKGGHYVGMKGQMQEGVL